MIRLISTPEVEVFFRNTYPDSPSGEDSSDDEEVIVIPVLPFTPPSFPHPHHLSPIPEEGEEEDEDEASSARTRLTSTSAWVRLDRGGVGSLCESRPRVESNRS